MTFAPQTIRKNINIFVGMISVASLLIAGLPAQAEAVTGNEVVIYQLQTGSAAGAAYEFIAVHNNGVQPADLTDWCLMYLSASAQTETSLSCLTPPDVHTRLVLKAGGILVFATAEFSQARPEMINVLNFNSGLAATGGHIKLLTASKEIADTLGWGSATQPELTAAAAHPAGKILERTRLEDGRLQDTGNNSNDFKQITPGPLRSDELTEEYRPLDVCSNIEGLQTAVPDGSIENGGQCLPRDTEGLLISEILPDAVGADSGQEFIEFYNPRDQLINLNGYGLQSGPSFTKTYPLPDISIDPYSYISLSDSQTKLSLPNTTSSVRLISPQGQVINQTEIYNQPGEGAAWASINGTWQLSYQPTPGSPNIWQPFKLCPEGQLRSPSTGYCRNAEDDAASDVLAICRPDQERSSETGRCRKVSLPSTAVCKLGQSRNPLTGRCSSSSSSKSQPAACKPGQQRNPQTKRCRSTAAPPADSKACPAGQQRSPDTNRCRKTKPAPNTANVKEVEVPLLDDATQWWLAGFASVGSVGYAVYEWRRDVWKRLNILKEKIFT